MNKQKNRNGCRYHNVMTIELKKNKVKREQREKNDIRKAVREYNSR